MPDWTDKHNAHIAQECEGWKCIHDSSQLSLLWQRPDGTYVSSPPWYHLNANARDRAAEAWRRQEEGREYRTVSAVDDAFGHRKPSAACFRNSLYVVGGGEGEHALLWALWKATGGQL